MGWGGVVREAWLEHMSTRPVGLRQTLDKRGSTHRPRYACCAMHALLERSPAQKRARPALPRRRAHPERAPPDIHRTMCQVSPAGCARRHPPVACASARRAMQACCSLMCAVRERTSTLSPEPQPRRVDAWCLLAPAPRPHHANRSKHSHQGYLRKPQMHTHSADHAPSEDAPRWATGN